jgi:serine protease AprX
MSERFIALRRPEFRGGRERVVVGEAAQMLRADFHATIGAALVDIGLGEAPPSGVLADAGGGQFHELPHLDAVLIAPQEATSADAVQEQLGDAYIVMPDFELTLPDAGQTKELVKLVPREDVRPVAEALPEDVGVRAAHEDGNYGEGVIVAVLDTGVDADHEEFAGQVIDYGYAAPGRNDVRGDRRGFDTATHGTHVCGIVHGNTVGIAPKADLIVVSVIESETAKTSVGRVLTALEWLVRRRGEARYIDKPIVLSMSLGFLPGTIAVEKLETTMESLRGLITELRDEQRILPVIAIGNDGADTVRAPGFFPEPLSVGAVAYDWTSWWKSSGGYAPAPFQTRLCPDIAGFGVKVVSCTGRDQDGKSYWGWNSGTSMATPYVAGIAALVSAKTGATGEALRQTLLDTALHLPGLGPERVGRGLARCDYN